MSENIDSYINKVIHSDCLEGLKTLPDNSVHMLITSPPYSGVNNMWGDLFKEENFNEAHEWLNLVWDECLRVLKPGCKMAINIANTKRRPYLPNTHKIYSWAENKVEAIGEIIWNKCYGTSGTAWGCFDEETECLTNNGWKRFNNIVESDLICTLNTSNRQIEYQLPTSYIKYFYNGPMYSIKNKSYNILITPNHNILYSYGKKYFYKNTIENLYNSTLTCIKIPKNSFSINNNDTDMFEVPPIMYGKRSKKIYINEHSMSIKMDTWLKFLGIFITDGCVTYNEKNRNYNISIYQTKKKYLFDIEKLLFDDFPLKFKFKKSKGQYYCCNKQLASYLNSNIGKKDYRKIPNFIHNLSSRQQSIFLHWVMMGDGNIKNGKYDYISVCSEQFANALLRIIIDCGKHASIKKYKPKQSPHYIKNKLIYSRLDMYKIQFTANNGYYYIEKKDINQITYAGNVYCLTLPNGNMLVRRAGKVTWSGNSFCNPSDPALADQHEYILMFRKFGERENKQSGYFLDAFSFKSWRNSIWKIPPAKASKENHVAPFPIEIPKRLILLYTYPGEIILDAFLGSGTTAVAALNHGRKFIGFEHNKEYVDLANKNINIKIYDDDGFFE